MPLLNPGELQAVLQILSENETRTFRSISVQSQTDLATVDHFRLACALIALLQVPNRLTVTQRLSAVFIVVDLGKAQPPIENPFLPLLEQVLQGAQYVAEQAFAAQLLLGFSQALDTTPLQVLALLAATDHHSIPSLTLTLQHLLRQEQHKQQQELHKQQRRQQEQQQREQQQKEQQQAEAEAQAHSKQKGKGAKGKKAAAGAAQPPKDQPLQNGEPADGPETHAPDTAVQAESAQVADPSSAPFRPSIMPDLLRPALPIMPVQPGEMQWMHPEMEHGFVWDTSIGGESNRIDSLAGLLTRAMAGPLLPAQSHEVLGELRLDMKLAFRCGLKPACLPGLVTHNPLIAVEVLTWLVEKAGAQKDDWLGVLVSIDMSLHSMEVVNRLTTTSHLPPSFLPLYIHNCLAYCRRPQEKPVQNRLVRLLSVFLTSLIRHRVVAVHVVYLEVQAFCIEFARIREAANLFRMLKELDGGEPFSETSPDGK